MLIHTLHFTRIDRIDPHSLFVLRRLLQDEEIELPSGDKLQRHAIDESKRIQEVGDALHSIGINGKQVKYLAPFFQLILSLLWSSKFEFFFVLLLLKSWMI